MSKHNKKQVSRVLPAGWYYMCTQEVSVEEIAGALEGERYDIEVWNEAGVVEVEIEEKKSMDIEACDLDMGDEFSNNYISNFGTKALYYISYSTDIEDKCKPILKKIVSEFGGKMCADSEDFTPEIK